MDGKDFGDAIGCMLTGLFAVAGAGFALAIVFFTLWVIK